jgi:serine/threonine-protein kinase
LTEGIPQWEAGTVLVRYRLEAKVGQGRTGVVWRARDELLQRLVALKIFAPTFAADPAFRLRFIRESRVAQAVGHPNILSVYAADEADGVLFIAMRLVTGGDLHDLLQREGQLPTARTGKIISQVASALDAAHATGLVHGDVKPTNILLDTRDGRDHVYVSDFGSGPSAAILSRPVDLIGPVNYLAPEQIRGTAMDGRADQYSLACITYQLLTGVAPFQGATPGEVLWAQIYAPPPTFTARRRDLPSAADQVLAKAMAKSSAERYRSCEEFADALRHTLERGPYPAGGVRSAPFGRQPQDLAVPPAPTVTRVVDDDVRFTVYRPEVLPPEQWMPLLVFAHKTSLVEQPGREPLDPLRMVETRARAHFDDNVPTPANVDARDELPRGVQLRIVPQLPGIQCNPPEATLDWWEPVHEVAFRLRAAAALTGTVARGAVRIWCGPLIFGEVSIAVRIAADSRSAAAPAVAAPIAPYRKIFPSYSHHDRNVVSRFAEAARALGDSYLQDVLTLRAGERWDSRLLELIEDADVFQLFWSRNSMRSPHCQREWEHALGLRRPLFVRPLYWEDPMPADLRLGLPPAMLRTLHFVRVPVSPGSVAPPPAYTQQSAPYGQQSAQAAQPPAQAPQPSPQNRPSSAMSSTDGAYAARPGPPPPFSASAARGPGGPRGPKSLRRRRSSVARAALVFALLSAAAILALYLAGYL